MNPFDQEINALEEILTSLNKHKDTLSKNPRLDIYDGIQHRINTLKMLKLFNIYTTESFHNNDWLQFDYNQQIGFFDGITRSISCSDNDEQPFNEYLYKLSFPNGAYEFGDDYNNTLFNKFFNELKSYNPKYCDTPNHSLYYTPENSKAIYDAFPSILKKYHDLSFDKKQTKIKQLELEIRKLKNQL